MKAYQNLVTRWLIYATMQNQGAQPYLGDVWTSPQFHWNCCRCSGHISWNLVQLRAMLGKAVEKTFRAVKRLRPGRAIWITFWAGLKAHQNTTRKPCFAHESTHTSFVFRAHVIASCTHSSASAAEFFAVPSREESLTWAFRSYHPPRRTEKMGGDNPQFSTFFHLFCIIFWNIPEAHSGALGRVLQQQLGGRLFLQFQVSVSSTQNYNWYVWVLVVTAVKETVVLALSVLCLATFSI